VSTLCKLKATANESSQVRRYSRLGRTFMFSEMSVEPSTRQAENIETAWVSDVGTIGAAVKRKKHTNMSRIEVEG
jgi:hypothetical protein